MNYLDDALKHNIDLNKAIKISLDQSSNKLIISIDDIEIEIIPSNDLFTGFDFLELIVGEIKDKKERKVEAIKLFIDATLDENGNVKDTILSIFEDICNLAFQKIITKNLFRIVEYKKVNKKVLALHLKIIFDKLDEYNKKCGKTTTHNYSSFTKLLKKEDYYIGYNSVKMDKIPTKCFLFDIEILSSKNIDLGSLGIC